MPSRIETRVRALVSAARALAQMPQGGRTFLTMQWAILAPCWALPFLREPDGSGGVVAFLCSLAFAILGNGVAALAASQLARERDLRGGRAVRLLLPTAVLLLQLGVAVALALRAEAVWVFVAAGVIAFPPGTAVAVAAGCARESWRIAELSPLRRAA